MFWDGIQLLRQRTAVAEPWFSNRVFSNISLTVLRPAAPEEGLTRLGRVDNSFCFLTLRAWRRRGQFSIVGVPGVPRCAQTQTRPSAFSCCCLLLSQQAAWLVPTPRWRPHLAHTKNVFASAVSDIPCLFGPGDGFWFFFWPFFSSVLSYVLVGVLLDNFLPCKVPEGSRPLLRERAFVC